MKANRGKPRSKKHQMTVKVAKKSVRASQLVSPFGVGAIVDMGGESFACMDISHWPAGSCVKLAKNNLEVFFKKEIRKPPSSEQGAAVPFTRFPRWLFCPNCRGLTHYTGVRDAAANFAPPTCTGSDCKSTPLVPMRFVAVCEHGHVQDVDWGGWAHRNAQASSTGQCNKHQLRFITTGASGGDFNAMAITCSACGAKNTFEGLTDRPYPYRCGGGQPWQKYDEKENCDGKPKVHPRGATNVYYPVSYSALDIDASVLGQAMGREVGLRAWLDDNPAIPGLKQISLMIKDWKAQPTFYQHIIDEACRQFELPSELVQSTLFACIEGAASSDNSQSLDEDDKTQHGILRAEWPFLSRDSGLQTQHLKTRPIKTRDTWPAELSKIWPRVTLVERLREVRALFGFRRLKPDSETRMVPVDLGKDLSWIPGVEMFGEGIFLQFDEAYLSNWETSVSKVMAKRMATLKSKCENWGRKPAEVYASPRFIAIHTFAHGLIRRLAFDAGYSSASLRERIYCDTGINRMAGILVYTSDGDSEGSLGGLVRQGQPDRFLLSVRRAIADLSWCSGDPVCSELENQGVDALNAAACHACCLLSETSCVFNNSLLDRRLLFGSQAHGIKGLFEGIDEIAGATP